MPLHRPLLVEQSRCVVLFWDVGSFGKTYYARYQAMKINAALDKDTTLRSDLLLIKTTLSSFVKGLYNSIL